MVPGSVAKVPRYRAAKKKLLVGVPKKKPAADSYFAGSVFRQQRAAFLRLVAQYSALQEVASRGLVGTAIGTGYVPIALGQIKCFW